MTTLEGTLSADRAIDPGTTTYGVVAGSWADGQPRPWAIVAALAPAAALGAGGHVGAYLIVDRYVRGVSLGSVRVDLGQGRTIQLAPASQVAVHVVAPASEGAAALRVRLALVEGSGESTRETWTDRQTLEAETPLDVDIPDGAVAVQVFRDEAPMTEVVATWLTPDATVAKVTAEPIGGAPPEWPVPGLATALRLYGASAQAVTLLWCMEV